MSAFDKSAQRIPGQAHPNDLDRDLDSWINEGHRRLDRLQDLVNTLPIIDAEGQSDCPFAGQLYAKKDEELRKALFVQENTRQYFPVVDGELERRRNNLQLILRQEERLTQPAPRQEMYSAQSIQAGLYQHLVQLRDRLVHLDRRLKEVITRAQERRLKGEPPVTINDDAPADKPDLRPAPAEVRPSSGNAPPPGAAPWGAMGSPPPVLAPPAFPEPALPPRGGFLPPPGVIYPSPGAIVPPPGMMPPPPGGMLSPPVL